MNPLPTPKRKIAAGLPRGWIICSFARWTAGSARSIKYAFIVQRAHAFAKNDRRYLDFGA
jgi:hypothetical protein